MKSVCVFLGSRPGAHPAYARAAEAMGRTVAGQGLTLVYGGSNTGLMKVLADAALNAGGAVTGITVRALKDKEKFHPGLTRLHVVDTMMERKQQMARAADGFIALPGGIGTLEELFEMLTLNLLEFHSKPCGLLDVNHYWDGLEQFLAHAKDQGFIQCDIRDLLLRSAHPQALLSQMAQWYTAPHVCADRPPVTG